MLVIKYIFNSMVWNKNKVVVFYFNLKSNLGLVGIWNKLVE